MASVSSQLGEQLGRLSEAATALSNLGDFKGATADSVKSYWGEAHVSAIAAICQAADDLATRYASYMEGYDGDSIDGARDARLCQDTIEASAGDMEGTDPDVRENAVGVAQAISDVEDIVSLAVPPTDALVDALSAAAKGARGLSEAVAQFESDHARDALGADDMIGAASGLVSDLESSYGDGGVGYSTARLAGSQAFADAARAYGASRARTSASAQAAGDAYRRLSERQRQRRAEAAAEALRKRAEIDRNNGLSLALLGAAAVVATVGTGGLAAFAVAGAACVAFGASDMAEAVGEERLAAEGDPWGTAANPLRDLFGDRYRDVYDALKGASALVAGVGLLAAGGGLTAGGVASMLGGQAVVGGAVAPALRQGFGGGLDGELAVSRMNLALSALALLGTAVGVARGVEVKGGAGSAEGSLPEGFDQVDVEVKIMDLPEGTWNKEVHSALERGNIVDRAKGNNTGHNFPVIDYFDKDTGNVVSFKSLDTGAKSYQGYGGLYSKLKAYIDKVALYDGDNKHVLPDGGQITPDMVKGRELDVVLPDRPLSQDQVRALNDAKLYADEHDVRLTLTVGR